MKYNKNAHLLTRQKGMANQNAFGKTVVFTKINHCLTIDEHADQAYKNDAAYSVQTMRSLSAMSTELYGDITNDVISPVFTEYSTRVRISLSDLSVPQVRGH